jgi:hypothetical protein
MIGVMIVMTETKQKSRTSIWSIIQKLILIKKDGIMYDI